MNLMDSFNNFYNNLSFNGLFFFWIVVFLFVLLTILLIVLAVKNNKLSKLLKERQDNSINQNTDDLENVEKEEISVVVENKQEENTVQEEVKKEIQEDTKKDNIIKEEVVNKDESGPYKKNVLREMTARMQTSPIHIERNDDYVEKNNFDVTDNDLLIDIPDTFLREDTRSPLEMMEDSYEINDNMKFASEIVERMEEEIKPSNIELTDYEKKQEEEAIISYDELSKVKDKIYNITEDEETDEFIDELKSFRLDLQ